MIIIAVPPMKRAMMAAAPMALLDENKKAMGSVFRSTHGFGLAYSFVLKSKSSSATGRPVRKNNSS
jgi:hypothetical protein